MKHFHMSMPMLAMAAVLSTTALPASAQQTIISEATDGQYDYLSQFPSELSGIGFRMPKKDFVDFVTAKGWSYRTNADQNVFLVSVPNAPFTDIMVRMNSDAGEFLTEIEIQFPDEAAAKAYFAEHYPIEGYNTDFYAFDPDSGYRTKAWQFSNKIFYVGVIGNTRWSNQ